MVKIRGKRKEERGKGATRVSRKEIYFSLFSFLFTLL